MKLSLFRKNQVLARAFNNEENDSPIALLSFDGKIRDKIIEQFKLNYFTTGSHIENGGKVSSKSILSLIGAGAGSVGIAGVASGQLFMATANPATLMHIGNGVGSAIMGAGKIVGQAPFISVSGALMPVVAPLIAFQVISTITIMKEFKVVNQKLDDIKSLIERNISRDEATNLGVIISVFNRIEDIEKQYSILKHFNVDMMNRLALIEDRVNPLFERYNHLYLSAGDTVSKNEIDYSMLKDIIFASIAPLFSILDMYNRPAEKYEVSQTEANFKRGDAYLAILTSILDLRVSLLRIKLNMQEAPEYLENTIINFKNKVQFYETLWDKIQNDYESIIIISTKMKETVDSMNWWHRNLPTWLGGKRTERIENEKNIRILSLDKEHYENILKNEIKKNKESTQNIGQKSVSNLLYWKDEFGEHSYHTDDLIINNDRSKHGT